jgi:hypothetical protein
MTFSYPNSQHVDSAPPAEAAAPAPAAPPAPPSEPAPLSFPSMQEPGERPAVEIPAEIRELRESDRPFYSPQKTYAQAIPDHPDDTPELQAVRVEGREIMSDLGMSDGEARDVVSIMSTELANGIPTDETIESWGREATQETFRRYGKAAEARLEDARLLVRRDPRVRRLLDQTGLGSHPKVVAMMIERARSERSRGRLR